MQCEIGLCKCGCGGKTTISPWNNYQGIYKRGESVKCIRGHCGRGVGGKITQSEYCRTRLPNHDRANSSGYVKDSILLAEKALGKQLPDGAVVHHANGIKTDNRPENLVICKNDSYHQILHTRMRALKECGNSNWRKCSNCKKYDDPKSMYINKTTSYHLKCRTEYNKQLIQRRGV